jgi:hypothetical protein
MEGGGRWVRRIQVAGTGGHFVFSHKCQSKQPASRQKKLGRPAALVCHSILFHNGCACYSVVLLEIFIVRAHLLDIGN